MATIDIFASPQDLVSMPKQTNAGDIVGQVVKGGVDYYNALNTINAAKYNSKLLKAQAQAAVQEAKAGGIYAAQAARIGGPSPSLLLVGGLALAALLVLKR
jgi:hypothetical protein